MYEKTQKRKNKNRLPFYRFSFYVRENTKTEKQKSTSVLSFFFLSTNKHIKRKNKNQLTFYRFLVFQEQTQKTGKRKPTSILTCFVLLTTKHQKRKMIIDFPFRCHLGQPTMLVRMRYLTQMPLLPAQSPR